MAPSHTAGDAIDYSAYKRLAEENLDYWATAKCFGLEAVDKLDIDTYFEAEQAMLLMHKKK